jgi:RHS repeat-associated protein
MRNHASSQGLSLLVKSVFGLLLFVLPLSAFACDEDLRYSVYPTHRMIEATCATQAEAELACYNFAESHGWTRNYCQGGTSGDGGVYNAGWLRDGSITYYYGSFRWSSTERAKPEKNAGAPTCPGQCFGDPINSGNGNKFESKVEYRGDGKFPLQFSWTYNFVVPGILFPTDFFALGGNRTFNYGSRISRIDWASKPSVYVSRPDGKMIRFQKLDAAAGWTSFADVAGRLIELGGGGWEFTDEDGHKEIFNDAGRLVEIRDVDGNAQILAYAPDGKLISVQDMNGRKLFFSYNSAALISKVTLPDGREINLFYTSEKRLSKVEYQDGNSIQYFYNEAGYTVSTTQAGALTGVLDEAGVRASSTTYNAKHATGTSLAGAASSYVATYQASPNGTYVTYAAVGLPSGASRQVNLTTVLGRILPRKIVTTCTGCAPRQTEYTYDPNGRYNVVTDNGVTTDYDFDDRGRPLQMIEAANDATGNRRTTQTDWHADFRVPLEQRIFDAGGGLVAKRTWTYNARGQALTSTRIDPATPMLTRTTTYSYCETSDIAVGTCPLLGLLTSENGPRTDVADITRYTYYPSDDSGCATSPAACLHRKGDLWKVENALGQSSLEVLRYDGAGRMLSTRDINGVTTDYDYHARGWPLAVKVRGTDPASDADDRITQLDYWPTGLVKKVTLPDGAYASYTYDAAHRLTDITDEVGNTIHYTLDNGGKWTREDTKTASGTLKRTLSRVYNLLDEVQSVKDASQNATTFSYDSHGNPDTTTDALGRVTDQNHDPLNRLIRSLQDVGGLAVETKLAYNALDQVTQVTDPKGLNTTYGYNGFGDQTQLSSPDTGVTSYTYDSAGNRGSQTDARGVTSSYSYDALNRLIGVSYPTAGLNTTYTYDSVQSACSTGETFAKGRLTAMTDASGSTQYCYDRFGQLARKVQSSNGKVFTLRYAYTPSGRISSLTYPDGAVANYVRDVQGKISQIEVTPAGATPQVLLNQASHHPFGPVAGWTYGNGRSLSRPLNLNYQPTAVQDSASGGLSVGLGFDVAGNLNQLTPAGSSTSLLKYDYDGLDRLTHLRDGPSNTPIETYSYDATGNRLSLTQAGGTQTYVYPATSHRLAQVGNSGLRGYDASGNTTEIDANSFVYNDAGRMSQLKQSGVLKMTYLYNGLGEQVRKYTDTYNRYMVYDESGHWLGEYDSNGATIQQAIWMDDLPVGVLADGGAQQKLHYVEPDHLGTPRVVIDPVRNVAVWSWDLKGEAFGNSAPNQDPDLDGTAFVFDMRFPGQRFDSVSGLSYNFFRDYEAGIGRYVQSDPIGLAGGISGYAYSSQNPIQLRDPLGLQAELNLFNGSDGHFQASARRLHSPVGSYTVAGHGNPEFMLNSTGQVVYPEQLAGIIKADPVFKDKGYVMLQSCNTGGPKSGGNFAQNLANALGKPVVAPNNYVFYRPDGTTYLADANLGKGGAAIPNTVGSWLVFFPQGGGK